MRSHHNLVSDRRFFFFFFFGVTRLEFGHLLGRGEPYMTPGGNALTHQSSTCVGLAPGIAPPLICCGQAVFLALYPLKPPSSRTSFSFRAGYL